VAWVIATIIAGTPGGIVEMYFRTEQDQRSQYQMRTFGAAANEVATPFFNQKGKMYVSLLTKDGLEIAAGGTLAIIEIEAIAAGKPAIAFDRNVLSFLAARSPG